MRIPNTRWWKNKNKRKYRNTDAHKHGRESLRLNYLHYFIGNIVPTGKFSLRHGAMYWTFLAITDRNDLRWSFERWLVECEGHISRCAAIKLFMWAYREWRKVPENRRMELVRRRAA